MNEYLTWYLKPILFIEFFIPPSIDNCIHFFCFLIWKRECLLSRTFLHMVDLVPGDHGNSWISLLLYHLWLVVILIYQRHEVTSVLPILHPHIHYHPLSLGQNLISLAIK